MTHDKDAPWDFDGPPPEVTRPFTVPFELLARTRPPVAPTSESADVTSPGRPLPHPTVPAAIDLGPVPELSPFDVPDAPFVTTGASPSRSFGVESTGSFRLEEFLSGEGDTLILGDPRDIVETAVVRSVSGGGGASGEGTRICIGRDIEAMLGARTILAANPAAPGVELSAFERFVLDLVDGQRTVEALSGVTGLSAGDLRIALAMLADKSQLVIHGRPAPSAPVLHAPAPPLVDLADIALDREAPMLASPWDVPSTASGLTTPTARGFGLDSVLHKAPGASPAGLSALEQFVFSLVDGKRAVHELVAATGLSDSDLKLAVELLLQRDLLSTVPAPPPPVVVVRSSAPSTSTTSSTSSTSSTAVATSLATGSAGPTDGSVEALLKIASRLDEEGNLDRCAEVLRRACAVAPRLASVHNRLAITLARQNDLDGALDAMAKALALSPGDPTIVSNHARIAGLAASMPR